MSASRNGSNNENISHAENSAPGERQPQTTLACGSQVEEKAVGRRWINLSQGEAEDDSTQQQSDGVVQVIEFERPAAGNLLGVSPASPAEHTEGHQAQRNGIRLRREHAGR
jgi:hypothetical protein